MILFKLVASGMVYNNSMSECMSPKRSHSCDCCRFQECTLTDVTAQDMVPPGRVMYLRRFKASPNASPIKQEEHRRRARARKIVMKPTSSIRRRTSSDSDSSGTRTPIGKLKQRLSHRSTESLASIKHGGTLSNSNLGGDQTDQTGISQHSGPDWEHQDQHRASSHEANGDSQRSDQSQVQEQAEQDEEEAAYRRAGLQKPRRLGEGESCCLSGLHT